MLSAFEKVRTAHGEAYWRSLEAAFEKTALLHEMTATELELYIGYVDEQAQRPVEQGDSRWTSAPTRGKERSSARAERPRWLRRLEGRVDPRGGGGGGPRRA